jgi:hypothetical protein
MDDKAQDKLDQKILNDGVDFPDDMSLAAVSIVINTFTAIVELSRFNNPCLKSPASTLVDLIFQSRSFSFNQLRDRHYRRETCTAASV